MRINLTELFTRDGKELDVAAELEMNSFHAPDGEYELVDRTPVRLHIVNIGNRTLTVAGKAGFALMIPCSRCLEPVKVPFSLDLDRTLDMKLSDQQRAEALEEQPYLQGYTLDVDRLVCDELILNLPMKVLCKDDCKGICNRCGANLNKTVCDCDRSSLDPRMSVIRDIFDQFRGESPERRDMKE